MKVDDTGPAPGLFARYRFYAFGRVPPRHDDWAQRHMGLGKWILAYVLFDLAVIFALCVWEAAFGGGLGRVAWIAGVFFNWHLLFAFLAIPRARRRARATLSPPPASVVLARIGEPVR